LSHISAITGTQEEVGKFVVYILKCG